MAGLWTAMFGAPEKKGRSKESIAKCLAAERRARVVDLARVAQPVELSVVAEPMTPRSILRRKGKSRSQKSLRFSDEREEDVARRRSTKLNVETMSAPGSPVRTPKKRLFKPRRASKKLQEKVQQAWQSQSESEAGKIAELKRAQEEELRSATAELSDEALAAMRPRYDEESPTTPRTPRDDELRELRSADRVANMVKSYEALQQRALREAERIELALREAEADDVRTERRRRRADALRARRAAESRGAVIAPTFSNISTSPCHVRLEIACETSDSCIWYSLDGGSVWKVYMRPIVIDDASKTVVLAYASKDHAPDSDVASSVFAAAPPRFVNHASHPTELALASTFPDLPTRDLQASQCALCRAPLFEDSYVDGPRLSYSLCASCALAPLKNLDPVRQEQTAGHGPAVALDAGAHRLWLSENVLFHGNTDTILSQSNRLLFALATLMRDHPAVCVRLEGHTNSKCGIDCDGTCVCGNSKCADIFGATGGALAFSKRRADAVRDWILKNGNLGPDAADRIQTQGFAGSRRVVDDTESPNNNLNRRVEVHTIDFVM